MKLSEVPVIHQYTTKEEVAYVDRLPSEQIANYANALRRRVKWDGLDARVIWQAVKRRQKRT